MKPRKDIALLGVIVLALIGLPMAPRYRAKWRLDKFRGQLQASGEKMTVDELAPKLSPDEIRTGIQLLSAASQLRSQYAGAPLMRILAPGRALAACREEVLPTAQSTNVWPGLELVLGQNEHALAQARAALSAPGFGFNVDYTSTANVGQHLARVKALAQWLSVSAAVELHSGQITNAWKDLDALANLAGGFEKESFMVSELVRVAVAAIALGTTWEALQCPGWNDEQLRSIQAKWESINLLHQAEAVFAMERCLGERAYAAGRRSYSAVSIQPGGGGSAFADLAQVGKEVIKDPEHGFKAFLHRYPGYWSWIWWQSYDDELASSKALQLALEAVRHARSEGFAGLAFSDFTTNAARLRKQHPSAGKWIGYSSIESFARFFARLQTIEMQRSLLIAAIALKRYDLRHGGYPAELGELSPEFLAQIPRDPIDGKPLRYRRNADATFTLYSIGENGVDDGGNPELVAQAPRQWWRARDAVWPWPATREQVETELNRVGAQFGKQQPALDSFRKRYGLQPLPASQTNTNRNR